MIYSTDINDLRADVAANCRVFISLMAAAGYTVQLVNTLRDQEYQTHLHLTAGAPATVTFHGHGLAFDVCEKKYGYAHADFFTKVGEIAQKIGFEWGGSWKKPDKPHIQWSNHGAYSGSMIIAGKYPPLMPLYGEDEDMTGEEIYKKLNEYLANQPCPEWAKGELAEAVKAGLTDGKNPCTLVPRYQAAIMALRATKK